MIDTSAIDPAFLALPLSSCADAALAEAAASGAAEVLLRIHKLQSLALTTHDAQLEGEQESTDIAMGVRVLVRGVWGFAAGTVITPAAASELTRQAVQMATLSAPLNRDLLTPAAEPNPGIVHWVAPYRIDPFDVPADERLAWFTEQSARLLHSPDVDHVDTDLEAVRETTFLALTNGSTITQQRVRLGANLRVTAVDERGFETLRTVAPPAGRGWEFLTDGEYDWSTEVGQLPDLLAEKRRSPSIDAGQHDLVIDATNLWLTIHESIGHATELDRILGYEANYAGTSFVPADGVGSLQYGSAAMNIQGDRTTPHGLATTGWDDEGVPAGQWQIVSEGVLTGFQLDRATAGRIGETQSNGCSFADSGSSFPLQRMANISLLPAPAGPTIAGLLEQLGDGLYIVGDNSWSIDMQRYNFQFTGQRVHRVKGGRIVGQVRDAAYQGRTPDFWGSMEATGGPDTYRLMGALNCGKAQPGQTAPVSHGSAAGLFRGVNILNTRREAQ